MIRSRNRVAPIARREKAGVLASVAALVALTLSSGVAAADDWLRPSRGEGEPLQILLTNDDGYDAEPLKALAAALRRAGHDVTVVAPCEDMTGSGTALSSDYYRGRGPKQGHTITAQRVREDVWRVCGTPADSVIFGLQQVFDQPPDLIVSGINPGQNVGAVANHSGTVGAVITGLEYGIPGIAVSAAFDLTARPPEMASISDTAAFTVRLIEHLRQAGLRGGLLPEQIALNVNYPAVDDPAGVNVTRQGATSFVSPRFVPADDVCPNCYLITPQLSDRAEPVRDADTTTLANGQISITPLDGFWTASPLETLRLRTVLNRMHPAQSRPREARVG